MTHTSQFLRVVMSWALLLFVCACSSTGESTGTEPGATGAVGASTGQVTDQSLPGEATAGQAAVTDGVETEGQVDDLCDAAFPAIDLGCESWQMVYEGACVTPGWILDGTEGAAGGFVSKSVLENICWNGFGANDRNVGLSCSNPIECGAAPDTECKEDGSRFGRMCTPFGCKSDSDCGEGAFCRHGKFDMCAPERCRALFDGFYESFGGQSMIAGYPDGYPCWPKVEGGIGQTCDPKATTGQCGEGLVCLGAKNAGTGREFTGNHSICTRVCTEQSECGAGARCYTPTEFGKPAVFSHCVPNECLRNLGDIDDQVHVPAEFKTFPYCGAPK